MKKVFTAFVLTLVLFVLPVAVFAQNIRQGDNVVLSQNEVIDKDYFATGNAVSLEGTVNGDAYLAGGNIVVNGTVNGDLLVAGGNLDIRGTVTGNIRAAGGNINISGAVGRNVTAAGGSINLAPNADIQGSLASAGGNINISSPIGRDANLAGGQVTLNNRVGGDINTAVDKLNLTSGASVNGNLTYLSRNTASIATEATVSGKITQNVPTGEQPREKAAKGAAALFSFFKIAEFILAAIIGLLLLRFLPVFFANTAALIVNKPWLSLGIGFLTVVIFPILFLLLLITIIGIPIAFILTIALAIYFYLAKIFISFVIGKLILDRLNKNAGKIWVFLLGLLIYYIIGLIPIFGWIFTTIAGLVGLGAILISKKNFYQGYRAKQII